MLVKDIKKLPNIFYFKSKNNPLNITYKAKKGHKIYTVTSDEDKSVYWTCDKTYMRDRLKNDDYVIVGGLSDKTNC